MFINWNSTLLCHLSIKRFLRSSHLFKNIGDKIIFPSLQHVDKEIPSVEREVASLVLSGFAFGSVILKATFG